MFGKLKSFFGAVDSPPLAVPPPSTGHLSEGARAMISIAGEGRVREHAARQGNVPYTVGINPVLGRLGIIRLGKWSSGAIMSHGWDYPTAQMYATEAMSYYHAKARYDKYLKDLQAYQQGQAQKESDTALELNKRLAELKTANELCVQQSNIERAKWQSEKEKLEKAILEAKVRKEEMKEQATALQIAKKQADDEKKAKQKKVRNVALVAAALAVASQVA